MKNISLACGAAIAVVLGTAGIALAAGADLTNGGVGQAVSQPQRFGVAVCDKAPRAFTGVVPVVVAVDGQSVTVQSVSPIAAGQCDYSYVGYSQLGMEAGQTYSANVIIDPQRTAISNSDNAASYSVSVPSQAANSANLTADAESQFSDPFIAAWNWIASLFGGR